jgi:hypothetical protein
MEKKFSKKRNSKLSKPFQSSKKNFSRGNSRKSYGKNKFFNKRKNQNGKKFEIKYSNEEVVNQDVNMEETNDLDIMKIGRFWDKKVIIEPKNTSNKIYISEDDFIYSLCENSIKVLNYSDLSLVYELKQVNFT